MSKGVVPCCVLILVHDASHACSAHTQPRTTSACTRACSSHCFDRTAYVCARVSVCSYLGYVDMYGTSFAEDMLATGMGTHLALPLIRERWSADMSEGEARALLEDCMRVCWYRDTRALNKITLAKVTSEGSLISEPYTLDTKWDFKSFVAPKAATDTGGSW